MPKVTVAGEGLGNLGILGKLGNLEELGKLGGIIGNMIIVPNGTNVERALSGKGIGKL